MADASSPVFYDVSDWSDGPGGDQPGIDRIPKLVCTQPDSDEPDLTNGEQYSDNQERWEIGNSDLGRDLEDSGFVFDRENPVKIGEHGSTELLFHEGAAVTDDNTTNLVHEEGSGLAGIGGFDFNARVEDSSDFDYDDCNTHWDETPLDAGRGFIYLTIEHRDADDSHAWWIGTDESSGYSVGTHGGNNSGNQYAIIWEGRMYEDGTVTDRDGSELGSWA